MFQVAPAQILQSGLTQPPPPHSHTHTRSPTATVSRRGSRQQTGRVCAHLHASVSLCVLVEWYTGTCSRSFHSWLFIGSKCIHKSTLPSPRITLVRSPFEALHQLARGLRVNPRIFTLKFLSQDLLCASAT